MKLQKTISSKIIGKLLIGPLLFFTMSCNNDDDFSKQAQSKAANYQKVLDEFTSRGIPGLSAVVVTPDGLWKGASGWMSRSK